MQNRSSSNCQGIDVSVYQDGLDFAAVKDAGIQIVYIKATEGKSYVNPILQDQYFRAINNGLKVGFYHYFKPGVDPIAQAQFFCNVIASLEEYACLPALDVEEDGGLLPVTLSALVHACLNEIAYITGHRAMIYCNTNYARNVLQADKVSMYPAWIADYNQGQQKPGDNPIWDTWTGFQYSSSGNIGGITVDLDEFTKNVFIDGKEEGALPEGATAIRVNIKGKEFSGYTLGGSSFFCQGVDVKEVAKAFSNKVTWDGPNLTVKIE